MAGRRSARRCCGGTRGSVSREPRGGGGLARLRRLRPRALGPAPSEGRLSAARGRSPHRRQPPHRRPLPAPAAALPVSGSTRGGREIAGQCGSGSERACGCLRCLYPLSSAVCPAGHNGCSVRGCELSPGRGPSSLPQPWGDFPPPPSPSQAFTCGGLHAHPRTAGAGRFVCTHHCPGPEGSRVGRLRAASEPPSLLPCGVYKFSVAFPTSQSRSAAWRSPQPPSVVPAHPDTVSTS